MPSSHSVLGEIAHSGAGVKPQPERRRARGTAHKQPKTPANRQTAVECPLRGSDECLTCGGKNCTGQCRF